MIELYKEEKVNALLLTSGFTQAGCNLADSLVGNKKLSTFVVSFVCPRLREAAGTLCVSAESVVEKVTVPSTKYSPTTLQTSDTNKKVVI